jgi:hypothetical protein
MDANTGFVQVAKQRFRPGSRDEGNEIIERFLDQGWEGLNGYLILFSVDDPDSATYLTFWSSEEAMAGSLKAITEDVYKALGDLGAGRAVMENNEIKELVGINKVLSIDIG